MDELRGGGFAAAGGVAQLLALFLSEGDSISICHAHFSREKQANAIRIFKCYRILGPSTLSGACTHEGFQILASQIILYQMVPNHTPPSAFRSGGR